METNTKKNNVPALVICAIAFIGCLFINSRLSRSGNNPYGGLLGQIEVVASLLMVLLAKKTGFIAACVLNGINAVIILFTQVIMAGRISALPGVFVSLISIVTLGIIYYYVSKNERINNQLSESYEKAVEQTKLLQEKDESLQFLAYYDTLTSMPNRAKFMEELNNDISKVKQTSILYIDIDNFRYINDTYGHSIGDELLKIYADKLKTICKNDVFAAKIGGDEFGVVLNESFGQNELRDFTAKVAQMFSEPVSLHGDKYTVTVSTGAAVFPTDSRSAELLFRCAETAMFSAKANGKNQLFLYARR